MQNGKPKETPTDRLMKIMHRHESASNLTLQRNICFGGAAACYVMAIQMAGVDKLDGLLKAALISHTTAVPLFIAAGSVLEPHILLGKKSYGFMRARSVQTSHTILFLVAGLLLLGGFLAYSYHFAPLAAVGLGASTIVAVGYFGIYQELLAKWYDKRAREDESDT